MSDVPMPRDLSIKAVALWLRDALPGRDWPTDEIDIDFVVQAEAVRALVEREVAKERASTREKVREAVRITEESTLRESGLFQDEIVARVMGDHPSNASGGHEAEGREVPRG